MGFSLSLLGTRHLASYRSIRAETCQHEEDVSVSIGYAEDEWLTTPNYQRHNLSPYIRLTGENSRSALQCHFPLLPQARIHFQPPLMDMEMRVRGECDIFPAVSHWRRSMGGGLRLFPACGIVFFLLEGTPPSRHVVFHFRGFRTGTGHQTKEDVPCTNPNRLTLQRSSLPPT